MIVYLTWHHGEDGPEGLEATLDRNKITEIALKSLGAFTDEGKQTAIQALDVLLEKTDEELLTEDGIWGLHTGWGGLHLQIKELT